MMTPFNLSTLLHRMAAGAPREFALQNLLPEDPLYGAFISPEHWLDESGHAGTTRLIVRWGLIALAQAQALPGAPVAPDQAVLLKRMNLAADYLLRVQRRSGLIDLRNTNYESGPDTAFALQLICAFIETAGETPALAGVVDKLARFARRAVGGVLESGFHTPNHRWVIVGALALARAVLTDIPDPAPVIDAYLAEGLDIDDEGAYLERSIGVYDAVTARSLLFYAEHTADPAARAHILAAVARNLEFDLHLLHPDGTAETGLSTRQDHGQRSIPTPLIANYLNAGLLLGRQDFLDAAAFLLERAETSMWDLEWLCMALRKRGDAAVSAGATPAIPSTYTRAFPANRLWRFRQDETSASAFGGRTRLFHLVYRSAELVSLKIAQAYFGVGLFIADTMEMEDGEVLLRSSGQQKPNLPAYHLPLGRPVAPAAFEASKAERDHKRIPPADSILKITPVEGGFDLHYRTLDGLDDVITQIAFDFPAGGLWETGDAVVSCAPGSTIFLKQGWGRMRYGADVIEIAPGTCAHLAQAMRHSEPPGGDQIRVLLTFRTPVDHRFTLRTIRLLEPR
ncbi:MAG: hypothetical protein L6Q98_11720 [Anaerolineae bacterium]|nr:hypothetical protein [Anaerolineae bacterium]NUQ04515.1 hypothetical protein [Anaerolineae bacterium]